VVQLRPDRIALYAYAHLPARVKSQRHIKTDDIPVANNKVMMLSHSIAAFEAVGYVYIGMDHFALPDDSLAVAKRQGRLHRNFQGYSMQPDCDLISLGISAIGKVGATYSQNAKDLLQYQDLIDHGHLPIVRGVALSRDDVLRRAVINALMCQGSVQFESVEAAHLIDFRATFASELARLRPCTTTAWCTSRLTRSKSPPWAGSSCAALPWCSTNTCRRRKAARSTPRSSDFQMLIGFSLI